MLEVPGDQKTTIYNIHYVGGPDDGMIAASFRPYHRMVTNGVVYEAIDPDNCLEWVNDWTYKIVLHYNPNADEDDWEDDEEEDDDYDDDYDR